MSGGSRVSGGRQPRIDPVVRLIRVDGARLLAVTCLEFFAVCPRAVVT
jgi:hypothetical protein